MGVNRPLLARWRLLLLRPAFGFRAAPAAAWNTVYSLWQALHDPHICVPHRGGLAVHHARRRAHDVTCGPVQRRGLRRAVRQRGPRGAWPASDCCLLRPAAAAAASSRPLPGPYVSATCFSIDSAGGGDTSPPNASPMLLLLLPCFCLLQAAQASCCSGQLLLRAGVIESRAVAAAPHPRRPRRCTGGPCRRQTAGSPAPAPAPPAARCPSQSACLGCIECVSVGAVGQQRAGCGRAGSRQP